MSDYQKYIIVKTVDLPPEQKYHGLSKDSEYQHLNTLDTLGIPMGEVPMTREEVEEVKKLPQVDFVEPVKKMSYPKPQSVGTVDPQPLAVQNINEAHNRGYKGKDVIVADLDTGLDANYRQQISNRIVNMADFAGDGIDDLDGHGTHTAGIINQAAPECRFLIVKVLDNDGGGYNSDIIRGINWAVSGGAQVLNMSLGGFPESDAANDSLSLAVNGARDRGVIVCVSSGNDQEDYPGRLCADESVPAAAAKAITVGAIDDNKNITEFSNHGTCLDIGACGYSITSWGLNGGEDLMSGTSMACPYVAGSVAVLLGAKNDPNLATTALYSGAEVGSLSIEAVGKGILNLNNSLSLLLGEEPQAQNQEISIYNLYDRRYKWRLHDQPLDIYYKSGAVKYDMGTFTPKGS